MIQKSKFLVSFVTPLVVTVLSVEGTFGASNITLKEGMTGNNVTELQKDLKSLGYMKINPTGYYGDITEAAVRQLQKKYGLLADGIAGKQTLSKIDNLQGGGSSSRGTSKVDVGKVVLKNGTRGAGVTELQKGLKKLGFMSVNPTGYYGDITETAVRKFQKKYGLSVDGLAGKQTINKIDSLMGSQNVAKAAVNTSGGTVASRSSSLSAAEKLISYARNFIGVKYRWGGSTAKGFDCSGFTKYVFQKVGITLSRVSTSQAQKGTYIKKANLSPGDLVFFDTNGGKNRINHVGIYIGGGKFIHSSSSHSGVTISSLSSGFYANTYMTGRRVL